jgi:hypothetical protein
MKTKTIIGIALLSVAIAAYLLMGDEPSTAPASNSSGGMEKGRASANVQASSPSTPVPQSNQEETDFSSVLSPQTKELLATGYVLTAEEKEKLLRKKRQKDSVPTMEELKVMMDTPVEFYGQVLDQFDQPVIGAKIRCSWPYMGPQDSARELQSAPDGQFEVLGLKALAIHVSAYPPPGYDEQVSVSKDILIAKAPERILQSGDYKKMTAEQKQQMAPSHGASEAYKGDKTMPEIFRLKKL